MDRPLFSETLSSRRRQLGFSTAQASRVLRLKEEVLIAFAEGDFEAMPKSGYAQGMLSSYARYLGLDAAQVVEMYADELEQWRREVSRRPDGPHYGATTAGQRSGGVGQPYVASRGSVREGRRPMMVTTPKWSLPRTQTIKRRDTTPQRTLTQTVPQHDACARAQVAITMTFRPAASQPASTRMTCASE